MHRSGARYLQTQPQLAGVWISWNLHGAEGGPFIGDRPHQGAVESLRSADRLAGLINQHRAVGRLGDMHADVRVWPTSSAQQLRPIGGLETDRIIIMRLPVPSALFSVLAAAPRALLALSQHPVNC